MGGEQAARHSGGGDPPAGQRVHHRRAHRGRPAGGGLTCVQLPVFAPPFPLRLVTSAWRLGHPSMILREPLAGLPFFTVPELPTSSRSVPASLTRRHPRQTRIDGNYNCACSDNLRIPAGWAGDPLRVAAVAPSSRSLASLMTSELETVQGPLSRARAWNRRVYAGDDRERGVRESELTLVERGPEFAAMLRQRFPRGEGHGDRCQQVLAGTPSFHEPKRQRWSAACAAVDAAAKDHGDPRRRLLLCPARPVASIDSPAGRAASSAPDPGQAGAEGAVRTGGTFRNSPPAAVYRVSRGDLSTRSRLAGRSTMREEAPQYKG